MVQFFKDYQLLIYLSSTITEMSSTKEEPCSPEMNLNFDTCIYEESVKQLEAKVK